MNYHETTFGFMYNKWQQNFMKNLFQISSLDVVGDYSPVYTKYMSFKYVYQTSCERQTIRLMYIPLHCDSCRVQRCIMPVH